MLALISALLTHDGKNTFEAIQKAKLIWDEIIHLDDETLNSCLFDIQITKFEKLSNEHCHGKLLMACTAIAYFYDSNDGFSKTRSQAERLVRVIRASRCSMEVKSEAEHLFAHYLAKH